MDDRTEAAVKESPYAGNRLMDDAWQKGHAARSAKRGLETCPFGDYPGKQFRRAWEEGWKAAAPPVVTPEPKVRVQEPRVATREAKDVDVKTPAYYHRNEIACPNCKAKRTDTDQQAVLCRTIQEDCAYLWCRACDHKFKLPVAP